MLVIELNFCHLCSDKYKSWWNEYKEQDYPPPKRLSPSHIVPIFSLHWPAIQNIALFCPHSIPYFGAIFQMFLSHNVHFGNLFKNVQYLPRSSSLWGAAASSLLAWWAAVWRVECSILHWGNVLSQIHPISSGCPWPNSAMTVQRMDGWMDGRCFRPLFCTVMAELGQGQPVTA